jgi:hypothetical protein
MNTAQVKLVTWSIAGVLGLGLVGYIAVFLKQRDQVMTQVSTKRMLEVLQNVPEIPQQPPTVVALKNVQKGLQRFDWTGKPPPEPVAEGPKEPEKHGPDPMEKFVRVRALKIDADQPERGEAVLKYTADARVSGVRSPDGSVLKHVGDSLDPPLDYIRVASITDAGIEFLFTDPQDRPHETLPVTDFPLEGYTYVVDGDSIVPRSTAGGSPIPQSNRVAEPNAKTQKISPTRYRIGVDDAKYLEEHYPDVLADPAEIAYKRHKDPKTGRYDGIELTSVKMGSIASQHGLMSGDIIKSINGTPVSSQSEAIQFVKTHKDEYDTWEVEIVNKGQTRTMTYQSPQH